MTQPEPRTWYADAEADDAEPGEGDELRTILRAVRRHIPLIVVTVAASTALAAIRTYQLQPVYAASARLQLAKEPPDPTYAKYMTYWEGIQKEYLNTQIAILESLPLAEQVLQDNPRIAKELEADVSAGAPVEGRAPSVEALAGVFQVGVAVRPVTDTYLVDITYESTDQERCARYANALAQAYMAQLSEQRGQKTRLVEEKIAEQAELLFAKLERSETELREFLSSSAPLFDRNEELLIRRISANNEALSQVQNERIRLDAQLEAIERILEQGRPIESAPAIAESEIIQNLRQQLATVELEIATDTERYGDAWPSVKQARSRRDQLRLLLREEINTIRARLQAERDRSIAEERALAQRARQLNDESRDLAQRARLYESLKSEVEANRRFYEEFATRLQELTQWKEVHVSNVNLVDPARGSWRVRPNHVRNVGTGALLGLALAGGVVLLLERLADKLRTMSEATRTLGLPALGIVPEVREVDGSQLDLYSVSRPHSIFAEAFRRLRVQLNAVGAYPPTGGGVLVCTSGVPREGKTVTAIGLALASAQAGKKTLLIDADMRSPRVHRTFDLPLGPGLGEILQGDALWGTVIRPTERPNLSLMTAGQVSENPAELLARGSTFSELLLRLRSHFDRVIIDTPPVAAVTDGTLMAPFADASILVVSARNSSRTASVLAKTELSRVGCEPRGLVFNHQGTGEGGYYYYYSNYFRRYPEPNILPPPAPRPEVPAASNGNGEATSG